MAASTTGIDASDIPEEVRLELALASRVLAKQGIVDAFGHVSCRHPAAPTQYFLMSSNKAPASVLPSDIQVYAIHDAKALLGANAPRGFIERYLHSEIYKKFTPEDVGAVVHCHALEFLPFGLAHVLPFKAAFHMASFLGHHAAPTFDLEHVVGEHNDLLIRDIKSGAALAKVFDKGVLPKKKGLFGKKPAHVSQARPCVLMRGHGATLVGETLRLAVMRAVYARDNARVLMNLHNLLGGIPGLLTQGGAHQGVIMLGETEAELSEASNASQVDRAWNLWVSEVIDGIPGASGANIQRRSTRHSVDTQGTRSYEGGRESFEGPQTSRSYAQSTHTFGGAGYVSQESPVQRQSSISRPAQQQQQPQGTHAQQVDAILNRSAPLSGEGGNTTHSSGTLGNATHSGAGGNVNQSSGAGAVPLTGYSSDLSRGNTTVSQRDFASDSGHSSAAANPGAAVVGASTLGNKASQPSIAHTGGSATPTAGHGATELERGPSMTSTTAGAAGLERSGSVLSHSMVCPNCNTQLA